MKYILNAPSREKKLYGLQELFERINRIKIRIETSYTRFCNISVPSRSRTVNQNCNCQLRKRQAGTEKRMQGRSVEI